ncbi:hypothetical protein BU23DRAFT_636920 [Bimuria novae-zelandiae CBS 107.79]|uniref:Ferric oxidoreductase domain-containing protein n=1 Tax=Bimuria novae-zelandiae CBS 107.79 TaxID=1447943 RepID=A0A6A5VPZ7_9PLEO|nr:hypothetical protein BU23DRAFT_636920 [Bimuria novae-zelandiae CBS 107.79]
MVFLLCGIVYHITQIAAVPLRIEQTTTLPATNQTVLHHDFAQSWVGNSPVRSSWEIIYACLSALITCFSSFVHINPPAHNERTRDILGRKVKWTIVAILVPEIVVLNAWLQWKRAVTLRKNLLASQVHFKESELNVPFIDFEPSQSYCFLVVNGGLVINTSQIHDTINRMTLTPAAVSKLADIGIFIHVSDQQISELQSIDGLGRTIAVWQICWLFVTVIGRAARHLPISLLELNTVINIAFALCLNLICWNNPAKNMSHPLVVLEEERYQNVLAAMLMATKTTKYTVTAEGGVSGKLQYLSEFDYLRLHARSSAPALDSDKAQPSKSSKRLLVVRTGSVVHNESLVESTEEILSSAPQEMNGRFDSPWPLSGRTLGVSLTALPSIISQGPESTRILLGQTPPELSFTPYLDAFARGAYLTLSSKDVHRWSLASSALLDPSHSRIVQTRIKLNPRSTASYLLNCLVPRAPTFGVFRRETVYLDMNVKMIVYITLALALHGAFHLTAWNWVFPTVIEKLLWKIFSFGLIAGILPVVPLLYYFKRLHRTAKQNPRKYSRRVVKYQTWLFQTSHYIAIAWIVFLGMCSVYLFLASFLALRRSPSGVYARLVWSSYLPSFS